MDERSRRILYKDTRKIDTWKEKEVRDRDKPLLGFPMIFQSLVLIYNLVIGFWEIPIHPLNTSPFFAQTNAIGGQPKALQPST